MTEEDEEFQRLEREAKMRRIREYFRKNPAEEDDDTQIYKKPWTGLTDEEYQEVLIEHDGGGLILFYHLIEARLREKNST